MTSPDAPIYLDYAATTPVHPEVAEAMLPFLSGIASFGNPSSIHRFGRDARAALDQARDRVAALIGADYGEIYFTSGGTEADNLAVIGAMMAAPKERNRLVTTSIEHHAILHAAHFIESQGYEVCHVPVDSFGRVSLDAMSEAVDNRTALVSVMHANNEIGALQPVVEIAKIAHAKGALFHTDGVQSAPLLPISVRRLDADMLTLSAHKMYGPKAMGALYIRSGVRVSPILHGGSQEREKRPGTENVAGAVGFGVAAEITRATRDTDAARLSDLRREFLRSLVGSIPSLVVNGHPTQCLPNIVNVSVSGVEGATLLMNLDRAGIAASSGSACSSGSIEPSHVLLALGLSPTDAGSGIRFSLGRGTTAEELARTSRTLAEIVARMRK
jgi:cysteine desulfurase